VYVGEISEVTTTPSASRYSTRIEVDRIGVDQGWRSALFVRDAKTQREIRLGDDTGDALLEALSDQYVIWTYHYYGQDKNLPLKTGLYAYDLESGNQVAIALGPDFQGYAEIDGQWVIYMHLQDERKFFGELRTHNLLTGEDFLVANNVAYRGFGNDYAAIGGDKIAWVEGEIRVYDLTNRTARTLNVPEVVSPVNLSISGDIVVWWDQLWVGYDLEQDILFEIPLIPPGWEKIQTSIADVVTVKKGQLYWALKVNDQVHRFTAPVIRGK
jgi:hypothetical protein